MTTLLTIKQIAPALGYAPASLRKIVADQGRPPHERKYPRHIHEGVPPMIKHGHLWKIPAHVFEAHMTRLGRPFARV